MNLLNNMCVRIYVSTQSQLRAFAKDEKGVTAIEYAIIAVAVSTLVLGVFNSDGFGKVLGEAIDKVKANIGTAGT
ncbi:Flp pilus assembly protein, pilin Flp [Moritella sp. JT01]|uniref:Flp family type IVb pilin n=1 Tax=Moritella sp. JT01 TaxID=756698 RepID=UPI00079851B3|nr:Flp family type IVb pilin [Moritella sp. JT01]KXO11880.1 Flp pilus assembly protein, pilin Flp [Moritella sp. JT01]